MLKLRKLSGDINWRQYGAKWITKKLNNGDFDYWLIVDFINFIDATGKKYNNESTYVIEIHSVAPSEVNEENKKKALESMGYKPENKMPITDETWAMILDDYGISANLYTLNGNNAKKLMKDARKQIEIITAFAFGFMMDKELNALGNTGWDFIKGNIGFKSRSH